MRIRAQYLVGVYAESYANYLTLPLDDEYSDYGSGVLARIGAARQAKTALEQVIESLWCIDSRLYLLDGIKPVGPISAMDKVTRLAMIDYHRRTNTEAAARTGLSMVEDVLNNLNTLSPPQPTVDDGSDEMKPEDGVGTSNVIRAYKNWMGIEDGTK